MPAERFEQLLDRVASLFGIGAAYYDIWGRQHFTTVAAKQAILRALGVAGGGGGSGGGAGSTRGQLCRVGGLSALSRGAHRQLEADL